MSAANPPTSPSEAALEIRGLTKHFKDFWLRPRVEAVSDLSLTIQPGEVFGLLGPNGSGKSTTIKMILGLLHPTKGSIRVLGQTPRDVKSKARIGYLPEESYLYPYLSAKETLSFYGRLFDIDSKYGDVVDLGDALQQLAALARPASPAARAV